MRRLEVRESVLGPSLRPGHSVWHLVTVDTDCGQQRFTHPLAIELSVCDGVLVNNQGCKRLELFVSNWELFCADRSSPISARSGSALYSAPVQWPQLDFYL